MGTSQARRLQLDDRYQHVEKSLEMLHMIAGGEAEWRARPFVSQSNCFVVPPLKFATDALSNACASR